MSNIKFKIIKLFYFFIFTLTLCWSQSKAEINVVTSIKPIHSFASLVMKGVATPQLIVDANNSPHNFTMKPSDAKMIQNADIIFWVHEDLEAFLKKPLKQSKNAKIIELMNINGLKKLKFREKNIFNDDHHDHGHSQKKEKQGHDHDHGHAHGEFDPHIWLDPVNAKVIIKEMTKQLGLIDPQNKKKYQENMQQAFLRLDQLISQVENNINTRARFVVFHDAYQYFEKRFNVKTLGALTVNTEALPGAEQLKKIRNVIKKENVACIFSEPQFNSKILKTIAQDTGIQTGVLEPLGANLKNDKDLYFKLIQNLSSSLKNC